MSLWQKLVLAAKMMTGGFESATDYLLGLLNGYLSEDLNAARLARLVDFASTALKYLTKYAKYCPVPWAAEYAKLVEVVSTLVSVLSDGKVTADEIISVVNGFRSAYKSWMED